MTFGAGGVTTVKMVQHLWHQQCDTYDICVTLVVRAEARRQYQYGFPIVKCLDICVTLVAQAV
jgi:hypothetical protein